MRNRSIRFKLTLWFSMVLIAVVSVTLLSTLWASRMVLRGTIRDYLISTVEGNVGKIQYVTEKGDTNINAYITYGDGMLQIDLDFMDVINDVHTALYTSDGTMLYGENPLSKQTGELPFTVSHTWNMTYDNVRYDFYDRKLNISLPEGETLWIRGIVPETKSALQLREIIRLSLLLLPILIFLAVMSGYLVVDRQLAPLKKIQETAEEISRGDDLKKRIEAGRNNDEVGRLAKVFNKMLDRLERSFETERRFTSDASHELRTPTAVILAEADYTLEKERSAEEYIEAMEVVQKQGNRMKDLISDMLDYTRMEQSSERYPMETLDLSDLVRETAGQMALLKTNGITLREEIEDGIQISGNRMLISRMLQNLISNAYRYGKENGHIDVSLKKDGEQIVLSVSDDGIGIAEEEQEKIFDRFYRSDTSRSIQGTGLGLSMVKKIAELHGAKIGLESKIDQGSTFRIIF